MTDPKANLPEHSESFDERVEILLKELELAFQWDRPSILFVIYDSERIHEEVRAILESYLVDNNFNIIHFYSDIHKNEGLNSLFENSDNLTNNVFFIHGINWLSTGTSTSAAALDHNIDIFNERKIRVVFWLTQDEALEMAHRAPDSWTSCHRVFEFTGSPNSEQALQEALESAWQETNQPSAQFEDTEAKTSAEESGLKETSEIADSLPERANLLLTLGILNWRKGYYEKADELLQKALQIASKVQESGIEAECYNAIALLKTSVEKNDDAIESYKQAIRLAPEQILVWNNLGNLCLKIGRNDEAMIAFQKAIDHNPKDSIAWNGMGDIYYRIGYINDAIKAYRKAVTFTPSLSHPWVGLGDAYASIGQIDESINAYQKSIELNNKIVSPWLKLAGLFSKYGRDREAIGTYHKALGIEPKNSFLWNELGLMYIKSGMHKGAIEAFQKAIELDPCFGWAHSNLGLAYTQIGKPAEAIQLYMRSIECLSENKDKATTWNRLADAYRSLKDYNNAIAAYQRADKLNFGILDIGNIPITNTHEDPPISQVESTFVKEIGEQTLDDFNPPVESARIAGECQEESQTAPYWIFPLSNHPEIITPIKDSSVSQTHMASEVKDAVLETQTPPALFIRNIAKEEGSIDMQLTFPINSEGLTKLKGEAATKFGSLPVVFLKSEAIIADSKNAYIWNEKGNVHFREGTYDAAIIAYNKAITLDSSFGWPYSNLALTYSSLGKYAEALPFYQKSLELLSSNKEKAVCWNGLGNIYRCLTDYANAVAAYQKADELDPENDGIHDNVEYFYTDPNEQNAQVWDELGDLFFKAGAYSEAANAYEKAVEMDLNSGRSFSNLALALVFQGKYQDAIPLYQQSIILFKDDKDKAASWNRLGNVYRKLNDYDNAIAAYQNAISLNNEQTTLLTRTRFSLLGNCYVD